MTNNDDLMKLQQDTTRKSMEDGLMYLPFGLVVFLAAFTALMPLVIPFLVIIIIFGPKAVERLREKYTYPRTGYVKLRVDDSEEMGKGIIGFLVITFLVPIAFVISIIGADMTLDMIFRWLPFVFGSIMIGPSLYLVDITGSRTYYLFGMPAAIIGLLTSLLVDQGLLGFQYFMMGWSIVIVLVGFALFLRFIRRYPLIEVESD